VRTRRVQFVFAGRKGAGARRHHHRGRDGVRVRRLSRSGKRKTTSRSSPVAAFPSPTSPPRWIRGGARFPPTPR
jgi:hypothetical protein